jgi:hypothetical protein
LGDELIGERVYVLNSNEKKRLYWEQIDAKGIASGH